MNLVDMSMAMSKIAVSFVGLAIMATAAVAEPRDFEHLQRPDEPLPERFGATMAEPADRTRPLKVRADPEKSASAAAARSAIAIYGGASGVDIGGAAQRSEPFHEPHRAARADLLEGVPFDIQDIAVRVAAEEDIDVNLLLSVMRIENAGFDPLEVSEAGAVGLMQVKPATGAYYGAQDLTDPEQNIRAAARFLADLVGKYDNPVLVAAAYNAGEPEVDANASIPLIRETADYVTKVVGLLSASPKASTQPAARAANQRTPKASRAASSMLVYSADIVERDQVSEITGQMMGDGPVRIKKEQ